MTAKKATGRKRVKFEIKSDKGSEIFLVGSFNNWDTKKKKLKEKKGVYSTTVLLPAGRHEYKYLIDGTWCVDPDCEEWTPNDMGSLNSVLIIS